MQWPFTVAVKNFCITSILVTPTSIDRAIDVSRFVYLDQLCILIVQCGSAYLKKGLLAADMGAHRIYASKRGVVNYT